MHVHKNHTTFHSLKYLWIGLDLPDEALASVQLQGGDDIAIPSSFKIGHLAQSSIALSGLAAALVHSRRNATTIPRVFVNRKHAIAEFRSEALYLLNGQKPELPWGSIGGLHKTSDGYVRCHDSFPNHRNAALKLLGCSTTASRTQVAEKIRSWKSADLENAAVNNKAVIFAMRSYVDWDVTSQAQAVQEFPITITKVKDGIPGFPSHFSNDQSKCLRGLRVLEMSRVIAAPVAGKTLAAHGADVLWITSPNLPDLPDLDKDIGRGKRTAQLDLNRAEDMKRLRKLLQEADVFLQSYRPGSLNEKGLAIKDLLRERNGKPLVCASLSAWGTSGPWSNRRGFDSIVQTASGMNVSEALHQGTGEDARPMPCQALDHGAGYFLASVILTALYRQATEGGSYQVDVSLAGVMKYLRNLGQYEGDSGFNCSMYKTFEEVPLEFTEDRDCAFGRLSSIKHSVHIDGLEVGWEHMPKPLGSDEAIWLS